MRADEQLRAALSQVEAERDDAVAYLSAIKLVLDAVAGGQGARDCAQRIAESLVQALAVEACAVALAERPDGDFALVGFATQAQRLGGPRAKQGEASWLTLARLVKPGAPSFFRRLADGSFEATAPGSLTGEGFAVLPLTLHGHTTGALLLHSLADPAQAFARGRAVALLADIVAQALTIAEVRSDVEQLCTDLEGELGVTRQALTTEQESVRDLSQALVRSNRVKRDFLGTVSHELRTPLNAILGYASLLREGMAGPVSEEQTSLLDRVLTNSQGLNALIDDVLFFVELEAGRVVVRRDRVAVRELVVEIAGGIPEPLDRAHVPVNVRVSPEVRTLCCDVPLLRRVLTHLLGNALKFTSSGHVTVTIAPDDPPGWAVVIVRDTGVGIPSERMTAVFELFSQADASNTRRFAGLGIGLTIVQRSVRLLGGEVTADSVPGQGSEFRVRIPDALVGGDEDTLRPGARLMH